MRHLGHNKDLQSAARRRNTKLFDAICEDCGWASYGWTYGAMAKHVLDRHRESCEKAKVAA